MSNLLIKLKNLNKRYKYSNKYYSILENLNLEIQKSQIISIIGPSGVGKTTLLNIIGLMDSFDSGEYFFNNSDVKNLNIKSKNIFRNKFIGFIHQFFHLIPELSVIENVALPRMISGINTIRSFKEAEDILKNFGLINRKNFKPSLLSGGEQQRVAIARAFANDPAIIWADELTGNLDSKTQDEVIDLIRKMNKDNNQTFIIVR